MKRSTFDEYVPEPHISNRMLAFWGVVLVCLWLYSSNQDYIEARMAECAKAGTTYQPEHDLCVKELANGTTQKN